MTRIAICSPSFELGDAVSNDALKMHQILSGLGLEVQLFAADSEISHPKVESPEKATQFIDDPEDILIYHFAIGWGEGLRLLKDLRCRKVIRYHNITPFEFFTDIHSGYACVCRTGRAQVAEIASLGADLHLANSEYSREELISAGIAEKSCHVVPPFHQIDRLRGLDADMDTLSRFSDNEVNVLAVGRLAPNKNHAALIEAFSVYHDAYNPNSRLLLVGAEDAKLEYYNDSLRHQVRALGLEDAVEFTGKVSDATLKACYLVADVFMTTSLHEGFCVPLVEAMALKIPIVAFATTAVKETLGKVAVVWEEYDPELLAASIDRIVSDEALRVSLGYMGWMRYRDSFANEEIGRKFLETMRAFL
jgi:glycosyltransferase involved in cell wall biosynthesis